MAAKLAAAGSRMRATGYKGSLRNPFATQAFGIPANMTPAARLQAVVEILGAGGSEPLDRQIKGWLRGHRFAGAKDRRAITERVYAIFRHRAHFAHRMASEEPRALVIASLLAEGENPDALFSGGYGPSPLTDAERAAIARPPPPTPAHVENEY